MNVWIYIRGGIVGASLLGGIFGHPRPVAFGYPWPYLAAAVFAFGVVGMLFIVGIQAFNPRSAPVWHYPHWTKNPFTTREPLQFFHLGGFFFLAAGIGALMRSLLTSAAPEIEPVIFAFWGLGILAGVWCCTRVFRRKMEAT
jgi:hypothetical protein